MIIQLMSQNHMLAIQADIELRKEFEQYTGIAANDYSWKVFTREQQHERYARQLGFWLGGIGKDSLKSVLSPKQSTKLELIHRGHVHTLNIIREKKFPETDVKIIMKKALILANDEISKGTK